MFFLVNLLLRRSEGAVLSARIVSPSEICTILCCPCCIDVFAARHSVVNNQEMLLYSDEEKERERWSRKSIEARGRKGQLKKCSDSNLAWCNRTSMSGEDDDEHLLFLEKREDLRPRTVTCRSQIHEVNYKPHLTPQRLKANHSLKWYSIALTIT